MNYSIESELDGVGDAVSAELERIFITYKVPQSLQAGLAYVANEVDRQLHQELDRLMVYSGGVLAEHLTGSEAARLIGEILIAIHPSASPATAPQTSSTSIN